MSMEKKRALAQRVYRAVAEIMDSSNMSAAVIEAEYEFERYSEIALRFGAMSANEVHALKLDLSEHRFYISRRKAA